MTDWNSFTEAELDTFADRVWGEGKYVPGIGSISVICPKCGSTARVLADETIGLRPTRFRATCMTCGTRGSGRATSHPMRRLEESEVEAAIRRHLDDLVSYCSVCQAPLHVDDLHIGGSSGGHFKVKCWRCGSHEQMGWPPETEAQ